MRSKIQSRIVAFVVLGVGLLFLLGLTSARSKDEPGRLYATVWSSPFGQLAVFDLEAKTVRVIGSIGYPPSAALAFCPSRWEDREGDEGRGREVAYTVTNLFNAPVQPQLATLDLRTGAATLVGSPMPLGQDIMGMTCSRQGTLYAVGESDPGNADYNSLYVIIRETGALARIGSTGVNDRNGTGDDMFMALAFAPDGKLYGANPFALYRIYPETGLAKKVVDFSANVSGNVMGMAIDDDGNFYLADITAQSSVWALDPHTGIATAILNTGLAYVHSIAFKTPDRE